MIISTYPGIDKVTYCKNHKNCINFESSNFSKENKNWVEDYCKNAINLNEQGFTVFVSSHYEVQEYLKKYFYNRNIKYNYWILMFESHLEDKVIDCLYKQALVTRLSKDIKALAHVIEYFKHDYSNMEYQDTHVHYGYYDRLKEEERLNIYWINSMNYNLETIITELKAKQSKFAKKQKEVD